MTPLKQPQTRTAEGIRRCLFAFFRSSFRGIARYANTCKPAQRTSTAVRGGQRGPRILSFRLTSAPIRFEHLGYRWAHVVSWTEGQGVAGVCVQAPQAEIRFSVSPPRDRGNTHPTSGKPVFGKARRRNRESVQNEDECTPKTPASRADDNSANLIVPTPQHDHDNEPVNHSQIS